jgi:hypothetical protein
VARPERDSPPAGIENLLRFFAMACPITIAKFVGTISLGLLTVCLRQTKAAACLSGDEKLTAMRL